ncbi:hypothetical protein, partial [Escherichia coli]|uniref:hypothetical protein n=1 Tax=Escherichia coli TaxID=562 RepID=UPI0035E4093F
KKKKKIKQGERLRNRKKKARVCKNRGEEGGSHVRLDVVERENKFYRAPGTGFYGVGPEKKAVDKTGEVVQSTEPLVVTMCFDTGQCIMTTRRANPVIPSR